MPTDPHEILLMQDSAYSVGGINTGLPANPRYESCYPMEAICRVCDGMVRRDEPSQRGWKHTGRRAGEP